MSRRWLPIILALALGGPATIAAGSVPKEPPLDPGTVWVYRYTIIDASGYIHAGLQRRRYGRTTYRGRDYYYIEDTNTVTPEALQRAYLVWSGGHFRQAALEMHENRHSVVEVLFDKGIPVDRPGIASGQATLIANGVAQGETPWRSVLSISGTETVTVPAGTFRARRMEHRFRFGDLKVVQTDDSVGLVSVRTESAHVTESGTVRTLSELFTGPVPQR